MGYEEDSEEEKLLFVEEDLEDFKQMKLAYQAVGTQIQVDDGLLVGGFATLNILELAPPTLTLGKTYFPVAKNDLLFGSLDGRMLLGSLGIPS